MFLGEEKGRDLRIWGTAEALHCAFFCTSSAMSRVYALFGRKHKLKIKDVAKWGCVFTLPSVAAEGLDP